MNKTPKQETKDNLILMKKCRYTEDGREILNPKPRLALVGAAKPLSDIEKMAKMTQANQMIEEMEKYTETWEEHNDFSIDDGVDEKLFNSDFTLAEDEIPESLSFVSEEAMEAAEKFLFMAEKIERGEINPDELNYDFLKKEETKKKEEEVKTETPPEKTE